MHSADHRPGSSVQVSLPANSVPAEPAWPLDRLCRPLARQHSLDQRPRQGCTCACVRTPAMLYSLPGAWRWCPADLWPGDNVLVSSSAAARAQAAGRGTRPGLWRRRACPGSWLPCAPAQRRCITLTSHSPWGCAGQPRPGRHRRAGQPSCSEPRAWTSESSCSLVLGAVQVFPEVASSAAQASSAGAVQGAHVQAVQGLHRSAACCCMPGVRAGRVKRPCWPAAEQASSGRLM